ncbi:hypothetical protein K469DRAFT_780187 [Zopfia rhizophila CBS 207.26]|uniref:Reverse transcriptase Ty1/copia-type domain-containing protein n=1 Tax=Zopfia rhizophila CBS 207.26 TaxID=1314779 RepID=A0A6A6E2F2_9PEZI|nr:hypothetical protein K469DRAFT_780187 [Zopfia rhizophila CBS 207.26]
MDNSNLMWIEEEPESYGASDAAFADDHATRKSCHRILPTEGAGGIETRGNWKATQQLSVTKSTTQAELLSLSTAAAELQWWNRFFRSIGFDSHIKPSLFCNNWQTVQLMQKDTKA